MPRGRPLDPELGDRVRALHAAGKGRNQIAHELGVSASTISKLARQLNLSFSQTRATAAATEARATDLRARRTALIERAYSRAERILDRVEADKFRYRITYAEESEIVADDDPPAADELRLSQAFTNYLTAAAKLELQDADGGVAEAVSMLGRLGTALGLTPAP